MLDNLQRIAVSQEQYDEIVGKLGHIDHASRVPPLHRKRLQTLLDEALADRQATGRVRAAAGDDPRMQEAVEQYKHQIGEEYRRELEKRKTELGDEVEGLKAKKRGVEEEIEEVRKRLAEEEALKQKTAEAVAEAVVARARQAQQEVHGLLAEVAVLRPFLSNGAAAAAPAERRAAFETHRDQAVDAGRTGRRLCPSEKSVGERGPAAALRLGLRPRDADGPFAWAGGFLSGVAGPGGGAGGRRRPVRARWAELDVPADMKDDAALKPVVESAAAEGPAVLLLNGANRSCIDAYGSDLVRILAERAAGMDSAPGLMVLGVLSEGLAPRRPTRC